MVRLVGRAKWWHGDYSVVHLVNIVPNLNSKTNSNKYIQDT